MTPIDNGGAAFPQHGWTKDPETLERMREKHGMSLRDWFAGQALAGILSNPAALTARPPLLHDERAEAAYKAADAMLAERAKGGAS